MAEKYNNIKDKAFNSVFWSAIERFSVQIGQIVVELILARLLLPADYGVVAMISVFIAIAQTFVDGGFANALIQKKDCSNTDYSTAFYFNVIVGIFLYFCIYFSAPFLSEFYKEPLLEVVTKIVGLNIIISSLSIVQRSRLIIELNFRLQAFISFVSILFSGTLSILGAYLGWGVWALVFQVLSYNTINVILLWYYGKWKPTVEFSKDSFVKLFGYGSKLLVSNLLQTIYLNLYTLVIGKKFSSLELGYYNRSLVISQVPSYKLTEIMSNAMFPIQCQLQDDKIKLRNSFISYLRMSCYIVFPLSITIAILADSLVYVVLTDKWLDMAPLLAILSIAYMWTPVMVVNNNIIKVSGRTDYFLKAEIIKKIIAVLILLTTLHFGLYAICVGSILYSFVDILIITRFSVKVINLPLLVQLKQILSILALTISMGLIIWITKSLFDSYFLQLFVGGFVGLTCYLLISKLIGLPEFDYIFSYVTKFFNKWKKK
ncbi:Lipopolysaccharide biosynthesis protein wzxC [uncultured Bacteroides sp.]|uniref:lipopolysaccharide biosynthesis protein n=1 Tax=Bacteroides cellulolyticus TaxID=2981780 RepID=UPI000821F2A1|nr:lipopolysaccharide biosynthesis protein [Bacteroides cellulolyticus]MCU6770365.1 lipopolysaccharide biosynthesis protein [Bacteroides cellulolyticus]SCH07338.1 Lipopolysaccharide biosynthesis protein wzxC [uncultured Bacteroides sp.]